jgi:preprotein translocase subunit YajC
VIRQPVFAFLTPSGGQSGPATMIFLVQILAFVAIFWFLLIRPQRQQQKKHEELLKQLKRGDEVVTAGGIIGRIVHVKDDRITIESGESRMIVERGKIATVMQPRTEEAAKA